MRSAEGHRHAAILLPVVVWSALALSTSALPVAAAGAETVHVFAAASLTEAFREIAGAFEKAHPTARVELHFAGSQLLRTQIEQGAPADVFASADRDHAEALVTQGLVEPVRVFARNALVVVTPVERRRVEALGDLARPGVRIALAGPAVPAGRYTALALDRMHASGRFGDVFRARVEANVVTQETSVRAVLAKVVLGEVDAGIVYTTDAASATGRVRTLEVPEELNATAVHAIGVATGARHAAAARAFVDWVVGAEAQAVLARRGFRP